MLSEKKKFIIWNYNLLGFTWTPAGEGYDEINFEVSETYLV